MKIINLAITLKDLKMRNGKSYCSAIFVNGKLVLSSNDSNNVGNFAVDNTGEHLSSALATDVIYLQKEQDFCQDEQPTITEPVFCFEKLETMLNQVAQKSHNLHDIECDEIVFSQGEVALLTSKKV